MQYWKLFWWSIWIAATHWKFINNNWFRIQTILKLFAGHFWYVKHSLIPHMPNCISSSDLVVVMVVVSVVRKLWRVCDAYQFLLCRISSQFCESGIQIESINFVKHQISKFDVRNNLFGPFYTSIFRHPFQFSNDLIASWKTVSIQISIQFFTNLRNAVGKIDGLAKRRFDETRCDILMLQAIKRW